MAKGRRLTTSRSEHFLSAFTGVARGHGYGTVTEESEYREEDIWSINIVDREDDNNNDNNNNNDHTKYFSGGAWDSRAEYGRREVDDISRRARIPRRDNNRHVGGLSLAFEETPFPRVVHQHRGAHDNGGDGVDQSSTPRHRHRHHVAASAPLNVPDWNRILHRVDSTESIHDSDEMTGFEGDNDGGGGWFPPHEYLARSRKSAATSVFEGVGRTLKGRDLSRLRDAVWSQTGFDG